MFLIKKVRKMAIEPIDLVINRKVLNGVVRYNGKNYAAFDLENKRVIFPFNSNVSLVHSSDNEIYFKYNGKNISLKNQAENIWVFQKCEHSKEDLIFQYLLLQS
ncbi:hypothetical protein ONA00_03525 [Mycoplasmopsis cynos]|uniref:hypothetical protein n=2 Tax=Mycoplasmopsis cynos TaxID=171284 RepID=UPI0024C650D9|nr:hypothetical protein [Mycoplasmopsis cynos]WAM10454.1 hypothetical protein ONA00_03525 [Mycoplasmopsis cynos]